MVMVSDIGASVSSYIEIPGFKLRKKSGNHAAEIDAPRLFICLRPTDRIIKAGNNISIGFGVKDLDSTVAYL